MIIIGYMEIYNFKEEKSSLYDIDAKILAILPFVVLVLFRFIRTVIFLFNSGYLAEYGFIDRLSAYLSIYINWWELLIAIIPVFLIILEKRSKEVIYYNFQYLIINLFIPLIYVTIVMIIFMILGIAQVSWVTSIIYMYGAMMLYGMYAIFMTIMSFYIIYCAWHDRTTNLPLISSISKRLAKL